MGTNFNPSVRKKKGPPQRGKDKATGTSEGGHGKLQLPSEEGTRVVHIIRTNNTVEYLPI